MDAEATKKHIMIGKITNLLFQKAKLKILIKMSKEGKDYEKLNKITDEFAINYILKSFLGAKK